MLAKEADAFADVANADCPSPQSSVLSKRRRELASSDLEVPSFVMHHVLGYPLSLSVLRAKDTPFFAFLSVLRAKDTPFFAFLSVLRAKDTPFPGAKDTPFP